MFEQIREEIKAPYYQDNFPNDGQRFVAWYLRNIHLRDMIETKDDITDGADDKQIDAIVIDDDKSTIFILQGKFIGGTNGITSSGETETQTSSENHTFAGVNVNISKFFVALEIDKYVDSVYAGKLGFRF